MVFFCLQAVHEIYILRNLNNTSINVADSKIDLPAYQEYDFCVSASSAQFAGDKSDCCRLRG
jgi:hypothetical protein